jgi:hypothetical protein
MNLFVAGLLGLSSICTQGASEFKDKMFAVENRIAFQNQGGMQNGGVCWWHSRFQRAAWSLAVFDPSKPIPSDNEALQMVRTLIREDSVVVIPGYANLHDFTAANESMIQHELNQWQIRDGFLNQAWLRGISGRSSLPAPKLKTQMDSIYTEFKLASLNQEVIWLMLQIKGIVSHASLIAEMTSVADGGYHLAVVDSNRPEGIVTYDYQVGDTSLTPASPADYAGDFKMVPYLGYKKDLAKARTAIAQHCNR